MESSPIFIISNSFYLWPNNTIDLKSSGVNDEKELLFLIANSDENAFRVIYDLYHEKIYRQVLFLSKDKVVAEDAIQEIFVKLWMNRDKLPEIIDLTSYLNVSVRNYVFNHFRKLNYHEKYLEHFLSNAVNSNLTTTETVDYNELHQRVNRAVSNLPRQQRRVYELSRSEGLKLKEIAKQLNISRETVKKHIAEALRTIRRHLLDYKHLILAYIFSLKKIK
jgi:RNA polymerase sigma-70 factor (family 1)